jgi:hypothetical protein
MAMSWKSYLMRCDMEEEDVFDDEDGKTFDDYTQKRCIECGEWGVPIDPNRAYMCTRCIKSWI